MERLRDESSNNAEQTATSSAALESRDVTDSVPARLKGIRKGFRGSISGHTVLNRVVLVNGGGHRYCSNRVSTAKYSLITFLPKFLFEQFRRYSNIFFLFIALMQQIPGVSPTGRYTTLVPLVFILVVSGLKEIFEDVKRHRADRGVNRSITLVLNRLTQNWEKKHWEDVAVGDVIKVTNDQFFPADLLLLASSEPNGMCYIETANLDGETNLKIRQSLPCTYECVTSEKVASDLSLACIECDLPNKHLYEFKGSLKLTSESQIYALTPDQILLRGAKLKNTNWVFGCVIYSGHETKLMMNSMIQSPLKQSKIEQLTNSHILSLFAVLAAIAAISTIASVIWNKDNSPWYLEGSDGSDVFSKLTSNPIFTFLTFVILYNNLIPISLQVTLEVVRFVQAMFINNDLEMYDETTDTPAMARTSNLNEELGQVKYVLTDKTGTLTRNIMEFKGCTVAGRLYTFDDFASIKEIGETSIRGKDVVDGGIFTKQSQSSSGASSLTSSNSTSTPSIARAQPDHNPAMLREFLTLLSVCHTVVPELSSTRPASPDPSARDSSPADSDGIKYQASSPDEGALVKGVAKLGFRFTTRTPSGVVISVFGKEEQYDVLNVLEFTSDRKRMSVIVRCPNGKIKVLVKGADNVINERLSQEGMKYMEKTLTDLEYFATLGFRTLCCAYGVMTDDEYAKWSRRYQEAISTADPSVRDQRLAELMDSAESNLFLIGATAVEDKLQEGVPDTIDILLRAGVRVWVLTGDKKETAINIGSSCQLIQQGMPLIILSEESLEATKDAIREHAKPNTKACLIIDGNTLRYAFSSPDVKKELMNIALACKAVICCRVSPIQKAEVVEMVKSMTGEVTLAIGDGANDVAMIRAANVGIGISGQEGLQAAHNADYSISQFRFLQRLLLVHGTWSVGRLCKLILYSFYKNIALYVIELWFATVSGWSGQTIFERWTIGMYNVIFTAFPPLAIGLFDRTTSAEIMIKYPKLYSRQGDLFSQKLFWIWVWSAIFHSLALFWLTYFMVFHDALWSSGVSDGGYLVFGNILYTYVVVTVCLKAALELSTWTTISHLAIWGSIVLWFIFLAIYSQFWKIGLPIAPDMVSMAHMIFSSSTFWMGLVLIPFMTLIIDIVYKATTRTCFKTFLDEVRDWESQNVSSSPSQQTLLSETARLIRNVFDSTRRRRKRPSSSSGERTPGGSRVGKADRGDRRSPQSSHQPDVELQHGYAFSQEEHGVVPQSQLIRVYDTTKAKPSGE